MHPSICVFYERRRRARSELRRQTVVETGPLAGCGLRFIPAEHAGNTNASAEEAERVAGLIREPGPPGSTCAPKLDIRAVIGPWAAPTCRKAFPTRTLIRATRDGYQLWELPGPGIGHVPTYRVEQDGRLVGEFPTPAAAATAIVTDRGRRYRDFERACAEAGAGAARPAS